MAKTVLIHLLIVMLDKYYKGIDETDVDNSSRTRYKWGFTEKKDFDAAGLESGMPSVLNDFTKLTSLTVRDEIGKATNKGKPLIDVPKRPAVIPSKVEAPKERSPPLDLGMIRPRGSGSTSRPSHAGKLFFFAYTSFLYLLDLSKEL